MKEILEIENQISEAIFRDLTILIEEHPDESFYGLALVSDDNFSSFFIALNTDEALNKVISEEKIEDEEDLSYYRWSPNEWQYMSYDLPDSHLKKVNREILSIQKTFSEKGSFAKYKMELPNSMIEILKKIILKINLLLNKNDIIIFMSKTDSSDTESYENKSAKILNRGDIVSNFINRYKNN